MICTRRLEILNATIKRSPSMEQAKAMAPCFASSSSMSVSVLEAVTLVQAMVIG